MAIEVQPGWVLINRIYGEVFVFLSIWGNGWDFFVQCVNVKGEEETRTLGTWGGNLNYLDLKTGELFRVYHEWNKKAKKDVLMAARLEGG